jgi:lipid-binding SYLF domain-containing protein
MATPVREKKPKKGASTSRIAHAQIKALQKLRRALGRRMASGGQPKLPSFAPIVSGIQCVCGLVIPHDIGAAKNIQEFSFLPQLRGPFKGVPAGQCEKVTEMKKIMMTLAVFGLAAMTCAAEQDKQDTTERLDKAATVLHEVMSTPDRGIPQEVMEHAKCVAVVPHMVKGGFVFGAEGGRGVATCRTDNGWSAPAFFAVTGGSWGLQIGVEGIDLVMVFQNDEGMKKLLASKFKVGADASAAAGPVGRHASADTDWKMNAEILTYSRAKGAFAGLTLSGASVRPDEDSMKTVYGPEVSFRSVLTGAVPPPAQAHAFLAAVRGARAESASR